MNEYNVTFTSPEQGMILLDVHRSSGTSQCAKFTSVDELRDFFSSVGLNQEKLTEIETICSKLEPREAYHESMFLPDAVMDGIDSLSLNGDTAEGNTSSSCRR